MSEIKLKNCPFCGYSYAEVGHDEEGWSYVQCHKVGCMARTDGCLNDDEAIKLWNTRKPIDNLIAQYKWERDIAISQLAEIGIEFGEKIVKECSE